MINSIDINKSGEIDYSEFVLAAINRESVLSEKSLKATFKMIDADGNGKISAKELSGAFKGKNASKMYW